MGLFRLVTKPLRVLDAVAEAAEELLDRTLEASVDYLSSDWASEDRKRGDRLMGRFALAVVMALMIFLAWWIGYSVVTIRACDGTTVERAWPPGYVCLVDGAAPLGATASVESS